MNQSLLRKEVRDPATFVALRHQYVAAFPRRMLLSACACVLYFGLLGVTIQDESCTSPSLRGGAHVVSRWYQPIRLNTTIVRTPLTR
jgi:hypothetical protein